MKKHFFLFLDKSYRNSKSHGWCRGLLGIFGLIFQIGLRERVIFVADIYYHCFLNNYRCLVIMSKVHGVFSAGADLKVNKSTPLHQKIFIFIL